MRDGDDLDDPVVILGSETGPIMSLLRQDGRWLVPEVDPIDFPTGPLPIAVVDTGVRTDHPALRGRVDHEVDLVGSGSEDRHGHGTAVAAILAATVPQARIISIKAMDDSGHGSVGRLCLALRHAATVLAERGGTTVNLSAGRRTPGCEGSCSLCTTTREVQEAGLTVVAAAGNDPGATYCPGRESIAVETPAVWDALGHVTQQPPGWRLA